VFGDLYRSLGVSPLAERLAGNVGQAPKRVGKALLTPAVGSKASAVYNTHSYHTKIPPEAIVPFIEHHTRPGDIVLDPFAGSGMTGVAARRTGRHAICNDLSPAAVHIAWNVTHPGSANGLRQAKAQIAEMLLEAFADFYRSRCVRCGGASTLDWIIWSDVLECTSCKSLASLWDAGFDRSLGTVASRFKCPGCRKFIERREARRVDSRPVWVSARCLTCGRHERPPLFDDLALVGQLQASPISDWYPRTPLGNDREMYIRSALHLRDIKTVADFYTSRNLRALARLWACIRSWPEKSVRQSLAMAFTNTAWHGTRMRRYNARGGQRPLTGTLYIPQLSIEVNVLNVFLHKLEQITRFVDTECRSDSVVAVRQGSATKLTEIPDASIDYVFTDPPFGSNIFYADCNLIWEAWLGALTDRADEAVVNRSLPVSNGGKNLNDYSTLIKRSFDEVNRVLKPNAWATVVFNNGNVGVWESIKDAISDSGLSLKSATYLDKSQRSHKGYKGRSGQEDVPTFDVVLALRKSARRYARERPPGAKSEDDAKAVIGSHLRSLPAPGSSRQSDEKRRLPFLHSLLLRHHFNGDIGLEVGSYSLVRKLCLGSFSVDAQGRWSVGVGSATAKAPHEPRKPSPLKR